jgi:hypothetical protein
MSPASPSSPTLVPSKFGGAGCFMYCFALGTYTTTVLPSE